MLRSQTITISGFLLPIACSAFAVQIAVATEKSQCTHMSEHQQTLDEGQRHNAEHERKPRLDRRFDRSGRRYHLHPELTEDADLGGTTTYWARRVRADYISPNPYIQELVEVDFLPLKTSLEIECAALIARSLEKAGKLDDARRLYKRILESRNNNKAILTASARESTMKDVQRVACFQSAIRNEQKGDFTLALASYDVYLRSISTNDNIVLADKIALLKPVLSALSRPWTKRCPNASEPTRTRALHFYNTYKKEWECLDMAEKLSLCAGNLESKRQYVLAEKPYKEALQIRERHLGKTAPETLALYGDLARLYTSQARYPEAQALYEQALAIYRKCPSADSHYANLLENYADMLTRTRRFVEADKIYGEARSAHKQLKTK